MADGKKVVVMWGRHRKLPLFVGTETECEDFILRNCEALPGGRKIYRVILEPDGNVYDVGQSVLYQIRDAADGNETKGLYNNN